MGCYIQVYVVGATHGTVYDCHQQSHLYFVHFMSNYLLNILSPYWATREFDEACSDFTIVLAHSCQHDSLQDRTLRTESRCDWGTICVTLCFGEIANPSGTVLCLC